jgi:exopolysaccharide production protein ExoZ
MASSHKIVGIQYLRGFAAVAVVLDHVSGMASFPKYFGRLVMNGFLQTGALGVSLFFVISGFIICFIALEGPALQPATSLLSFAEKRFTRIVPLMWIAILSYAILRFIGRTEVVPVANYLRAFTLFPVGGIEPNQIWTLRHEALFYLMFALSFLCPKRFVPLLIFWFSAPLLYWAAGFPANPHGFGSELLWFLANPVNIEFGAGFTLGYLFHRTVGKSQLHLPQPMLLLLVATLLLMLIGYLANLGLQDLRSCLIASAVCLPIAYVGIYTDCPAGILDSIGRLLGNASFAIYLFHLHAASAILGIWAHLLPLTPPALVVVGTSIAATCFGVAAHIFVERPLLEATRRLGIKLLPPAPPKKIQPDEMSRP